MLEMFVGSSTESEDLSRKIARKIAQKVNCIVPRYWRDTFSVGNYTLSSLIRAAEQSQLALLMFCADDIVDSRSEQKLAPRDNILLEAGLFLSRLGPRRVALVMEDDVKFPTDLNGLVHVKFSRRLTDERIANEVARQLADSWAALHDPSALGLERTLRKIERRAATQLEDLYFPETDAQRRIIVDSSPCTEAYVDGLNSVSKRFWTTSFLTSAFWTGTEVETMLAANQNMMKTLNKGGGGSARRVFMLAADPEQFLLDRKAEVRKLRIAGDKATIREMKQDITNFRNQITRMTNDGFDTRISYDTGGKVSDDLIRILRVRFRRNDTELAIYDDFRVDLFSGGSKGVTDQLISFYRGTGNFNTILTASERYFEQIWDIGENGPDFIRLCEDAIYRAAEEIDYTPNWLAQYDYNLTDNDRRLKAEEFDLTAKLIADHYQGRTISKYLDIGSCTARYPIELLRLGLFDEAPSVLALENDEHAFDVMKAKLEKEGACVTPQRSDFMLWESASHPRDFNLVTCMLGTISHLAAPGPKGESQLSAAIQKMAACLVSGGILVLGCWSEQAIRRKDFLAIYTEHDKSLLSKWTPSSKEMMAALEAHGFRLRTFHVAGRIDLYFGIYEGSTVSPLAAPSEGS